jgi:hypothetical protein
MKTSLKMATTAISTPAATVLAALIGALGLVIGNFLTPLGQHLFPPNEQKGSLPQPAEPQNTQASGSAMLGHDQICWGQNAALSIGPGGSHVRSFSFTFAKPFRSVPAVTTGINVRSSGYTFAVYDAAVTETEYAGRLVETKGRDTDAAVSMSYTAIGEPK